MAQPGALTAHAAAEGAAARADGHLPRAGVGEAAACRRMGGGVGVGVSVWVGGCGCVGGEGGGAQGRGTGGGWGREGGPSSKDNCPQLPPLCVWRALAFMFRQCISSRAGAAGPPLFCMATNRAGRARGASHNGKSRAGRAGPGTCSVCADVGAARAQLVAAAGAARAAQRVTMQRPLRRRPRLLRPPGTAWRGSRAAVRASDGTNGPDT